MIRHVVRSANLFFLLQPIDVSHIYVGDLHEARQEKKQRSPTVTKVRHCHRTLLGLWSTLPSSLQVMGRLTFWDTWPGGLRGGLGEDEASQEKTQRSPTVTKVRQNLAGSLLVNITTMIIFILHFQGNNGQDGVLRSRGGAGDENKSGKRGRNNSSEDEESFIPVKELKRPPGWSAWEEKQQQRPAPLLPPRSTSLEFANMTVRAICEEDGVQVFSQYKDRYMRSEVQLQKISDAQADQRKVAGGVYRCLERDQEGVELVLHKGYKSKTLGIVLRKRTQGRMSSIFESFGDMKYEYFKFSAFTDGLRWRQQCPERTPTGYIWTGVGGEMALPDRPSSDVFVFCERVDRDLHFSQGPCERMSEAPGASQSLCSNLGCGLVVWHLSRKCFRRNADREFVEVWQEDFALVSFKSLHEKLFWSHPHRRSKQSWWERLDSSPQYDAFIPDAGSRRRAQENFGKLPPWNFDPPCYTPRLQSWTDPIPLEREADNSSW